MTSPDRGRNAGTPRIFVGLWAAFVGALALVAIGVGVGSSGILTTGATIGVVVMALLVAMTLMHSGPR